MKTIIEKYPDKIFKFTMPDDVFQLITGAYEQAQNIQSNTTYAYMYNRMPPEIKSKIKLEIADDFSGVADIDKMEADVKVKVYDMMLF